MWLKKHFWFFPLKPSCWKNESKKTTYKCSNSFNIRTHCYIYSSNSCSKVKMWQNHYWWGGSEILFWSSASSEQSTVRPNQKSHLTTNNSLSYTIERPTVPHGANPHSSASQTPNVPIPSSGFTRLALWPTCPPLLNFEKSLKPQFFRESKISMRLPWSYKDPKMLNVSYDSPCQTWKLSGSSIKYNGAISFN